MRLKRRSAFAALALSAALITGCTAAGEDRDQASATEAVPEAPRTYVARAEVLVTRDSKALPDGCRPADVAGLITTFLAAVNRADPGAVNRFIAKRTDFGWYSMTEGDPDRGGRQFFTEELDRLRSYLRNRYRHGERLRLLLLHVSADTPESIGMTFVLTRHADDLKPGWGGRRRIAEGKGNVDCATQTIRVWSAGMDAAPGRTIPPHVDWSCPRPTGWDPIEGPIVACAST